MPKKIITTMPELKLALDVLPGGVKLAAEIRMGPKGPFVWMFFRESEDGGSHGKELDLDPALFERAKALGCVTRYVPPPVPVPEVFVLATPA